MTSPIRGCVIASGVAQGDRLRHELYIDTGDADHNAEIFGHLRDQQEQVEAAYGRPLEWEELPTKRACRIAEYKENCALADTERWDEYIAWFLGAGTRLRAALSAAALPA
jgi:hypothetical protein